MNDIKRVVDNNSKKRFHLEKLKNELTNLEELYIRANQGHSLAVEVEMEEIDEKTLINQCIHGTYLKCWELIKNQGLSKMSRQHIHMSEDFPDSKNFISGMRRNCQIVIFIDVKKALQGKINKNKFKLNYILYNNINQI